MNFSKFKFKPRDLFVGLFLISPLVALVIISLNPAERSAKKADEARRGIINSLAKAAAEYKAAFGVFPEDAVSFKAKGILDWTPENPEEYIFSDNGADFVIYARAKSLAWKEYCGGNTSILYSSRDERTDLVCGEPEIGSLKFVN